MEKKASSEKELRVSTIVPHISDKNERWKSVVFFFLANIYSAQQSQKWNRIALLEEKSSQRLVSFLMSLSFVQV